MSDYLERYREQAYGSAMMAESLLEFAVEAEMCRLAAEAALREIRDGKLHHQQRIEIAAKHFREVGE